MGVFSFLPKCNRCCFCTNSLKIAALLIIFVTMYVGRTGTFTRQNLPALPKRRPLLRRNAARNSAVAGTCAVSMCLYPSCTDIFSPSTKGIVDILNVIKWVFFYTTILLLISCFVLFLAVFLQAFPRRSIPADVYVGISFVWTVMAFVFAAVQAIHYANDKVVCRNPSDFVAVFMFFPCMMYFTCVINSYITQADDM